MHHKVIRRIRAAGETMECHFGYHGQPNTTAGGSVIIYVGGIIINNIVYIYALAKPG